MTTMAFDLRTLLGDHRSVGQDEANQRKDAKYATKETWYFDCGTRSIRLGRNRQPTCREYESGTANAGDSHQFTPEPDPLRSLPY